MFFRSTTIAPRPDCTSEIRRSPNSFAVVLSSRPYASTIVTSSLIPSTNFIPGSRFSFRESLHQPQLVDSVAARIFEVVCEAADEMQSYTAFTGFVAQIGWGDLQRIERPAVVLNDDLHVLAPQLEAH